MTYSFDLINSALNYHKISKLSLRNVAKIFGISKSVLFNWTLNLPLKYNEKYNEKYNNSNNITPEMLKFLKRSLYLNPYQIQSEMIKKINKKFSLDLSVNIIKKMLKILNYTKKKASRRFYNKDLKKHKCNKREFKKKIKKINKDDIICLDEVGITRDTYKSFGYCHSTKRLEYYVDINSIRIKKSLIVAISNEKVIQYEILTNKNVNGEIFKKFIENLTKKIKNKYILMDNINFHKSKNIIEIIKKSNNEILFIPPYSPEFNPIEKVFSVFKAYINKNINPTTKFKNIDNTIKFFFEKTTNLNNYYIYSFG